MTEYRLALARAIGGLGCLRNEVRLLGMVNGVLPAEVAPVLERIDRLEGLMQDILQRVPVR